MRLNFVWIFSLIQGFFCLSLFSAPEEIGLFTKKTDLVSFRKSNKIVLSLDTFRCLLEKISLFINDEDFQVLEPSSLFIHCPGKCQKYIVFCSAAGDQKREAAKEECLDAIADLAIGAIELGGAVLLLETTPWLAIPPAADGWDHLKDAWDEIHDSARHYQEANELDKEEVIKNG